MRTQTMNDVQYARKIETDSPQTSKTVVYLLNPLSCLLIFIFIFIICECECICVSMTSRGVNI
jgi:hypothetical protein